MLSHKFSLLYLLLFLTFINTKGQDLDNPYNPEPKMELLKSRKGEKPTKMHFLVFGDSKGSKYFPGVLKRADSLQPDFCITTADLVNKGAGEQGEIDYKLLDEKGRWFMRKYPMWPTVGNHEESGGENGIENFTNFFGMKTDMYSFQYGNAKFIALPWPKISDNKKKLKWLKRELRKGKNKHIFIYKHRPNYTLGNKSYEDVEGTETKMTKLFDKYNVTAVFSGHDHIYYRTKRNNTNYIISAGAGASIYSLKREKDAIKGDAFYGKRITKEIEEGQAPYKFQAPNGTVTDLPEAIYYVLSVKIDGEKVSIEMIDEKTGKVWDKADIK
ncbi:metallophosphoesterase [uncultured Lutibacter sp.]|uniref:metallophosphoesterase family protein n=1 Tax=uncultured Lutibacter sp. TaxID=437739 RepID=UPI002604C3AC|nr:metallophosphoesterase [uncultured Lutibacter sp.]